MDFSGAQMDKLATMLEYDANIERDNTKTSEERILIALEAKAGGTRSAGDETDNLGADFADRILSAVKTITNYPDDGESGGGK